MSLFKRKTFQEKYRVFGSVFFEANNGFNLEKSDKLVLPPKTLQKLTELGLDFPMTLRVTPISRQDEIENGNNNNNNDNNNNNESNDKNEKNTKTTDLTKFDFNFNDINGRSLLLSNVADFTAPGGSVIMSNWLMKKLGFNLNGINIVELEAVGTIFDKKEKAKSNNVKLMQYPCVEYVELQPFSIDLLRCNDLDSLVKKHLNMYYSSLRKDDIINVEYNNKIYKLQVIMIRGKHIQNIPQVVIINDSGGDYAIGFSKVKVSEEAEMKDDNDDGDDGSSSSDEEWEVIKVGPITEQLSELSELEPDKSYDKIGLAVMKEKQGKQGKQGKQRKDNKNNYNNNNEYQENDYKEEKEDDDGDIIVHLGGDDLNNNNNKKKKNENDVWQCSKCGEINSMNHHFCPKCGLPQEQSKESVQNVLKKVENNGNRGVEKINGKDKKSNINHGSLQVINVLNPNRYEPGESRTTGWELRNISNHNVKVSAKLSKIAGDGENLGIFVKYETPFDINVKPNESVFFVIEVKAPIIHGKFTQVFELRDNDDFSCLLCSKLPITYEVNRVFSLKKEKMIREIYNMGFTDRKKIVDALNRQKWILQNALNQLLME